ncbi:Zinc finger C2H2 superfamily [Sergentomyia squamirostris]
MRQLDGRQRFFGFSGDLTGFQQSLNWKLLQKRLQMFWDRGKLAVPTERQHMRDCALLALPAEIFSSWRHEFSVSSTVDDCSCSISSDNDFNEIVEELTATLGGKKFICPLCNKNFRDKSGLRSHMMIHSGQKPFQCQECGKSFTQSGALTVHLRTHTGDRPYSCDQCGKRFVQAGQLKVHLRTHNGERMEVCPLCGKKFSQKGHLKVHLQRHRGERPFACKQCGKSFLQPAQLRNHMRTHTGEKPFECPQCGKKYTQASSLKHHQLQHQFPDRKSKSHLLDLGVDKTFDYYSSPIPTLFQRTQDAVKVKPRTSTKPRIHECYVCKQRFVQAITLRTHMRLHTGEKPYQCQVCLKRFIQQAQLKVHLLIHTGEKHLECPECGKRFNQTGHLKQHQRTHTKEKPYKCPECPSAFAQTAHLKAHLRTHTGEKPFVCPQCGKSFTQPCSLKSHVQRHEIARFKALASELQSDGYSSVTDGKVVKSPSEVSAIENIPVRSNDFTLTEEVPSTSFEDLTSLEGVLESSVVKENHQEPLAPLTGSCLYPVDEDLLDMETLSPFVGNLPPEQFSDMSLLPEDEYQLASFIQGATGENSEIQKFWSEVANSVPTEQYVVGPNDDLEIPTLLNPTKDQKISALVDDFLLSTLDISKQPLHEIQAEEVNAKDKGRRKQHECSVCGKCFPFLTRLRQHFRVHSGERPYECVTCGLKFSHLKTMKRHQSVHTGEKPFLCQKCGKGFAHDKNLKCHLRTHTGEKPYECSICGMKFSQSGTLKSHQMTHTGEKPFICSECGMRFVQSGSLKIHMRKHSGVRPYKCPECDKEFYKNTQFKIHLMIHTGEKPNICNICGKAFTQSSHLKVHVAKQHSETEYKI